MSLVPAQGSPSATNGRGRRVRLDGPEADESACAAPEQLPESDPKPLPAAVVDDHVDAGVEDEEEVVDVAEDEDQDGDVEPAAVLAVHEGQVRGRGEDLVKLDAEVRRGNKCVIPTYCTL